MTPLYLISQFSQPLALDAIPILISLLSLIVALGSFRTARKSLEQSIRAEDRAGEEFLGERLLVLKGEISHNDTVLLTTMSEDVRLQWGEAFFPRELDSSSVAYRLVGPDYKVPLGSLRLKLNLIFGAIELAEGTALVTNAAYIPSILYLSYVVKGRTWYDMSLYYLHFYFTMEEQYHPEIEFKGLQWAQRLYSSSEPLDQDEEKAKQTAEPALEEIWNRIKPIITSAE